MGKGACRKSDIWSLGCTLIEMLSGERPWPQFRNQMALLYHVANSEDTPPTASFDSAVGEECRDFIATCLMRDQEQRWLAAQLSTHPFVAAKKASAGLSSDRTPADPPR